MGLGHLIGLAFACSKGEESTDNLPKIRARLLIVYSHIELPTCYSYGCHISYIGIVNYIIMFTVSLVSDRLATIQTNVPPL